MRSVLSIDVANGKSEVLLMTEHGEVLIEPYEVKHCLNEFNQLKEKIESFNLDDLIVFMESTSTYHLPIQRFFTNNNFKEVFTRGEILLDKEYDVKRQKVILEVHGNYLQRRMEYIHLFIKNIAYNVLPKSMWNGIKKIVKIFLK